MNRSLWLALLLASGATGLVYEVVWMRRLGLLLGGTAVASSFTIAVWMGGMALGSLLAARLDARRSARGYAALEATAAVWALAMPWLFAGASAVCTWAPALRWLAAAALLMPPTMALGATWPLLARVTGAQLATRLYAANTVGAVVGTLGATFVLLPGFGVRGTELIAALAGAAVAWIAWGASTEAPGPNPATGHRPPSAPVLAAVAVAGFAALGLEVVWMRIAAVAFGMTVQNVGVVLATFLAAVAVGAALGSRWPADARLGLGGSLAALGALALLGAASWGWLPYAMGMLYRWGGPDAMVPGSALLAALAMGGAPVASGVAFASAVRMLAGQLDHDAGPLYAANTAGSIAGALLGGLWAVPVLEVRGAVALFAIVSGVTGAVVLRRAWPAVLVLVLAWAVPPWDARLYAVGVHLRVSDFADPSQAELRRFVDEGWELVSYDQGRTGAVAVGRSTRSDNVWLSVNGKVDASTGDDMATQRLSGELPLAGAPRAERVLVVGLASGVTAGAVLEDERVRELVLLEIEPAIVQASHHFDHINGRPLQDPRTELHIDDARAWLQRSDRTFDVIISEPSNPWITGVSNLFTQEYWALARRRLAPDGVFCQWVQLYGMGTEELRAIVRTFSHVFPDTHVFETVPGADLLMVSGLDTRRPLPLVPLLGPPGVKRLGGLGWRNTDDHPRVEFRAPGWLHYATGEANREVVVGAR